MAQEKQFENKVKKYLDSIGAWYVKYHGNAMSANGTPDILACINGFFFGIEVKASNGKPSDLQRYKLHLINRSGGVGVLLYPEGFEEFKKICEGVKICNTHIQGLNVLKDAHTNIKCDIIKNYE